MKHIHLDEFAKQKSPLHGMDARAKAVSFFFFIFLTVTMTQPIWLLVSVLFWILMLTLAKIPLSYVMWRTSWVLPFAGVLIVLFPFMTPGQVIWTGRLASFSISATEQGLMRAVMLLLRLVASLLALVALMSTTRFNIFMQALAGLKIPHIILHMVEFTIRYIFVTLDEVKRMRRARKSRGFVAAGNLWHLKTLRTLAQMIGLLFIRAYERGDRVYVAMLSRGFRGEIKTVHQFSLKARDVAAAASVMGVGLALWVLDRGGIR